MKKIFSLAVIIIAAVVLLSGCLQQPAPPAAPESADQEEVTNTNSAEMVPEQETEVKVEEKTEEEDEVDEEAVNRSEYYDVTVEEAKELIDNTPDLVIIDVSPKYDEGHLPGAINYYLGDGSLDAAIPTLDKDATYLVYCHVDSVSILGAQKLADAGFDFVYRLEGNYAAWVEAGYEIEK